MKLLLILFAVSMALTYALHWLSMRALRRRTWKVILHTEGLEVVLGKVHGPSESFVAGEASTMAASAIQEAIRESGAVFPCHWHLVEEQRAP